MANTFSAPQVSHHHLFIFPFDWNRSPVWHDVFSSLSAPILSPSTAKLVAPRPVCLRAGARPGGGLDACKAGRERCSSLLSLLYPLFLQALRTCTLCLELTEVLRFQTGMSRKSSLLIHTATFLACAPAAPPWSQRPFLQCFSPHPQPHTTA